LAALLLALVVFHFAVERAARLVPPAVTLPQAQVATAPDGVRRIGQAYARRVGSILQVGLAGDPDTIGYSHARLLYPEMVENEGVLLGRFEDQVPMRAARSFLLDLAQLRYHDVDRQMAPERLREIAAGSQGFQPDRTRSCSRPFSASCT
jgi:hypothetical protein